MYTHISSFTCCLRRHELVKYIRVLRINLLQDDIIQVSEWWVNKNPHQSLITCSFTLILWSIENDTYETNPFHTIENYQPQTQRTKTREQSLTKRKMLSNLMSILRILMMMVMGITKSSRSTLLSKTKSRLLCPWKFWQTLVFFSSREINWKAHWAVLVSF